MDAIECMHCLGPWRHKKVLKESRALNRLKESRALKRGLKNLQDETIDSKGPKRAEYYSLRKINKILGQM